MKTVDKVAGKAKLWLTMGSLVYGLGTLATFAATSQAIRGTDSEFNLTKNQRMIVNKGYFNEHESYSLPKKALWLGEYLAHKLYQENLEKGIVEGVSE